MKEKRVIVEHTIQSPDGIVRLLDYGSIFYPQPGVSQLVFDNPVEVQMGETFSTRVVEEVEF